MKLKLYPIKLLIAASLFFLVCACGTTVSMYSVSLSKGETPGAAVRLKLISVENETDILEFQLFHGGHAASAFVSPLSTFKFAECKPIELTQKDKLVIKCVKGSFVTVFVQDGDCASGQAEEGYDGPFYISMWLEYPQVSTSKKVHVRYMVKKGEVGTIGLKIGKKGDYRLVAHEGVKFIE